MADKKEKNEISFEEAIEKLSSLVDALEDGKAPLDQSLKMFEEGVKLAGVCKKQLDEAERKVKILTEKQDGSIDGSDFEISEKE